MKDIYIYVCVCVEREREREREKERKKERVYRSGQCSRFLLRRLLTVYSTVYSTYCVF